MSTPAAARNTRQPAGLVILGAYVFQQRPADAGLGNRRALRSGVGQGAVGKNYCYQVSGNSLTGSSRTRNQPFMASGSHGTFIDDFNGDNFDHAGLGFFGGAWIQGGTSNGRPILTRPVRPARRAGAATGRRRPTKWYGHAFNIGASGCNYAHRENYLDLDPTYTDALGRR